MVPPTVWMETPRRSSSAQCPHTTQASPTSADLKKEVTPAFSFCQMKNLDS